MTSYAESAPAAAGQRRRVRQAREATRPRRRRSTAGGIAWIAVLTVLLAGVVAVNVAVLRLNVRLDRAERQRVQLRADVARLQSDLSSAASSLRIQRDAQAKLGVVPADPSTTRYLRLPPR